jgi:hypothetical protein
MWLKSNKQSVDSSYRAADQGYNCDKFMAKDVLLHAELA